MQIVTMIDTIGTNAHNIPAGTARVAGYITGTGGVRWSAGDWRPFPIADRVLIDQSPMFTRLSLDADVVDAEPHAAAPASVVDWVRGRIAARMTWSVIYGTAATLLAVRAAMESADPPGWWHGHVRAWLANWDLDQEEAAKIIGTQEAGMTCVAVQWASPASNPRTLVPRSSLTLAEANVDLSVCDASWRPALELPVPMPLRLGYLVTGQYSGRPVSSADGGKTWS